jgi:hypothetical protein
LDQETKDLEEDADRDHAVSRLNPALLHQLGQRPSERQEPKAITKMQ